MIQANDYVDLKGNFIPVVDLDDEERKLVSQLKRRAKQHPDWNDFENYWTQAVWEFYQPRGLTQKQARATGVYRIAQDLGSRLAIEAGIARAPDYRDELDQLIRTHFPTRRAFCQAAGLSEDMLSHVMAGRKHLAIDTLAQALGRIGFTLKIMPVTSIESTTDT